MSEENQVLEFVLELAEVPVRITDPGTKEVREYVLREMNGRDRDSYLNALSKRVRITPQGRSAGFQDYDGLQADLIHRCLYNAEDKRVPKEIIQTWPARIQDVLFKKAHEMNALDKDADSKAKNA